MMQHLYGTDEILRIWGAALRHRLERFVKVRVEAVLVLSLKNPEAVDVSRHDLIGDKHNHLWHNRGRLHAQVATKVVGQICIAVSQVSNEGCCFSVGSDGSQRNSGRAWTHVSRHAGKPAVPLAT